MSSQPDWLDRIEFEARGRTVLLVEGEEDVALLSHYLTRHAPGWELQLHLAAVGGKPRVIAGVAVHRPSWIGIVDHDESSDEYLLRATARSPRLRALPRFCIESYFCVPEELWAAIPEAQRATVNDNLQVLASPILDALPDWIAHGAMWRVLRRLYLDARMPEELDRSPVTDEAEIRRILQAWHDRLAPDRVLDLYRVELCTGRELPPIEQLRRYVHGKRFFNQVVVQTLDRLFKGAGRDEWLQRFRDEGTPPPPDLTDVLDWALHLASETPAAYDR